VAFRQNTSDQETLWNLGMIVNNVELTTREIHGFLKHGDTRRQGQFTEEDFKRIIHVGYIVLDSLEAIRTNIFSRFHPSEE
jgi:hypothetical protein